jgi:RNA polymerase sigma-70 factor (ECF subfamily)
VNEPTLQRIAAGDRAAVAECIDRYGKLVWSLARRFTHDQAEAEDAVQEVFIDLWSHAGRYDPAVATESTFIAMIARRRLIDRLRKSKRQPGIDELTAEAAIELPSVQQDLETRDEAARAARVIAELRPEQQKVLELSVYHGLTHSGIAEQLGMPIGTVKTHLRRGLIAIRERLGVAPRAAGKQVVT